jgi:hypothetical protein
MADKIEKKIKVKKKKKEKDSSSYELKNTISKGQFFYFFKVILELPHVFNEMN